ncbi:MAG: metallophosphoesterase [Defluviitaleaceae bacterium]|nr:metallophosphoesterase [Defluviitaleaceae bacterium]
MFRWLHISDTHFDVKIEGVDTNTLRDELVDYLKTLESFDALIITGDLCSGNKKDEDVVNDTVRFIKSIADAAGISNYAQIYMVPGNHDVQRSDVRIDAVGGAKREYESKDGSFDSRLEFLLSSFSYFREVEKGLYSGTTKADFLPEKDNPHFICVTKNLCIIHLNTAIFSCENGEEGHLRIGNKYLHQKLKDAKD